MLKFYPWILSLALIDAFVFAADPPLDVVPADVVGSRTICVFDLKDAAANLNDWFSSPTTTLSLGENGLLVNSTGKDPCFITPDLSALNAAGDFVIKLTARRTTTGFAQIFVSERDAEFSEVNAPRFAMDEDGPLREYAVAVHTSSPLKRLRFDLGLDAGVSEVSKIEIVKVEYAPIKFGVFSIDAGRLRAEIVYSGGASDVATIEANGVTTTRELAGSETFVYEVEFPREKPFEALDVRVSLANAQTSTTRRFFTFYEDLLDRARADDWPSLTTDAVEVRFAPDASGAEVLLRENGLRVAALAPLVCAEDGPARILPNELGANVGPSADVELNVEGLRVDGDRIDVDFKADGKPGVVRFRLVGDELSCDVDSPVRAHAPVVRTLGGLTQAVFPGVEFLEKGERSSSSLDVNPRERARFAPPAMSVTAPFAVVVTDRGSTALAHDSPDARTCFASPDFMDGDERSSRFDVCAAKFSAVLRFAPPEDAETAILWAVAKIGLPEAPERPRTTREEDALHLAALTESALKKKNGWALAVGPSVESDEGFYCTDFLSTLWELTGKTPDVPKLDVGGANLRNYASLLILGRGDVMKSWLDGEAANIRAKQKEDGSFRYSGPYLRGSSVDYASGDCAKYVFRLLDHWRLTGDKASLAAGLKGVAFINTLRVPRGAQTWELSLHTPDLVAASRCCLCNVLAYQATKERRFLDSARRWAAYGLPFVYLWEAKDLPSASPVMRYASVPVFGTTDWIAPCWIGMPVQWCGLDYADALLALAPYDAALDWRRIAEGLVTSAEGQEYAAGPYVGLLPDSYTITAQQRNALNLNPCVEHMLRRKLDGAFTDVSVVDVAGRRVVAPFPARVDGRLLTISAKKGVSYQILIDGKELRSIDSQGEDVVEF